MKRSQIALLSLVLLLVVLTLPALARAGDVPAGWTWDEPTLSVESASDGWTWDESTVSVEPAPDGWTWDEAVASPANG